MRAQLRNRGNARGGIISYPLDKIYEEVAFIAFHFHWSPDDIMNMEHRERQRWTEEISGINRKISGEKQRSILEV